MLSSLADKIDSHFSLKGLSVTIPEEMKHNFAGNWDCHIESGPNSPVKRQFKFIKVTFQVDGKVFSITLHKLLI